MKAIIITLAASAVFVFSTAVLFACSSRPFARRSIPFWAAPRALSPSTFNVEIASAVFPEAIRLNIFSCTEEYAFRFSISSL